MLRSVQEINNQGGKISALGRLDVQGATEGSAAGRVQNAGGKLLADGDLVVTAQSLNNTDGLIDSQKSVRLNLNGMLDNRDGKLQSNGMYKQSVLILFPVKSRLCFGALNVLSEKYFSIGHSPFLSKTVFLT